MKKLALLFILVACELVFGTELVQAASELEMWCLDQGASWNPDMHYCAVFGLASVDVDESLTILPGELIDNNGTVSNSGTININKEGFIENWGGFNNYGTVQNSGVFYNVAGTISNWGTIDNHEWFSNDVGATISNWGTIDNHGAIGNGGTFDNYSVLNNYCFGTYNGIPPSGNAIVDIACLRVYLPLSCKKP